MLLSHWAGLSPTALSGSSGDELDEAIVQHVRRTYNLLIGERTAERVKHEIGTAFLEKDKERKSTEIRGRDLVTGLPKTVTVTDEEIHLALAEPIQSIVEAVKVTLERTPPELAADIMDKGIILAGGSSLLCGLTRLLSNETAMPVHLSDDPLTAVARGTGTALEHFNLLQRVMINSRKLG